MSGDDDDDDDDYYYYYYVVVVVTVIRFTITRVLFSFLVQDEEDFKAATSEVAPGSKSKLAKQIQELVKMIFDVDMMKKTMIEFEVDSFLM